MLAFQHLALVSLEVSTSMSTLVSGAPSAAAPPPPAPAPTMRNVETQSQTTCVKSGRFNPVHNYTGEVAVKDTWQR